MTVGTVSHSHTGSRLHALQLWRYRAFTRTPRLEFGRVTLILGRNNAGKSALTFAPAYLSHVFSEQARDPLPGPQNPMWLGGPLAAVHGGAPSGLRFSMEIAHDDTVSAVHLGVSVDPQRNNAQTITQFSMSTDGAPRPLDGSPPRESADQAPPSWERARRSLLTHLALTKLPFGIRALKGVRGLPKWSYPRHARLPAWVGFEGQDAPQMLLTSGGDGLRAINKLYAPLGLKLSLDLERDEDFRVLATGANGSPVNITNSGAGVAQILPLFTQLALAERMPELYCIEQPELHLHPGVHAHVADSLLSRLDRDRAGQLLIETHSDAFVLRIRRHIAEQTYPWLTHESVRIYFVDDSGPDAPTVRPITLDTFGSPDWWPEGVFAEPQQEYFAIRRAMARRTRQEGGKAP